MEMFFWYSIFFVEHSSHSFSFSLTCYTHTLYVYRVIATPYHTQRHTRARTNGRTPLNGRSAHRRDIYLTRKHS